MLTELNNQRYNEYANNSECGRLGAALPAAQLVSQASGKKKTKCLEVQESSNWFLVLQANLVITITFPYNVSAGKAISNFDVMDKLRQMVLPDNFSILKVS